MAIKDHKSLQDSRILLVEDDKSIRLTVSETLISEGFKVSSFKDGLSALDFINNDIKKDVDLIILDLMLPGLNGLELCRKIRNDEDYTPILILSAKDNESDRVLGLEVGADDYLTKPFGLNELIARSRALIRRSKRNKKYIENSKTVLEFNHIKMFLEECRVTSFDREITLSPKEFKLLELFMKNPKRVWSRDLILEKIWEIDFIGDTKTVDVHVRWLREKLEEDPSAPKFLKTVRGFGYKFG
ncbi:two component transcriptional regulator, winged helix family [Prochlorococcus marinus str. MIT 9312]|jgi:two-component system phosphate regulon response regulator PhoB|uniref:Two component transcriptional regulator, winged helix family n=1 Tax=Prochlorococcus marinus (strain MIT 9312) TaxID=74546 RepID=Q31BG8_PROM9|nr:response regulator transcription factor [Prochlorococcus marinus]ABB49777.1 two component transcriptional regulator, winged helix family [Prochlorococcus marinus str. MIT 9312]KGF99242.1 Phosphate regulon transcriptional regulatory protein PhoB (SphR) [Prochlorococcus marinus str. MIT 9311]